MINETYNQLINSTKK